MTTIAIFDPFSAVLLFGRNKEPRPITQTSGPEKTESKQKLKSAIVGKYEFSEGKLTFYVAKGLFKKRWETINEFPVAEITNVDNIGNGLIITWNGATYSFLHQKKSESFRLLYDQILGLLAEQQQTKEKNQKETQLKADLKAALDATLSTVDLTFDLLIRLHEKRVNWQSLNAYSDRLVGGVSWIGQSLPPLNVELYRISDAITKEVPKEVSKEALGVLKAIYGYFSNLSNKEDATENSKLFENARNTVISYLMLNDVMFARITGQEDDPEEIGALENVLSTLIDESNIEISLNDVVSSIQKTSTSDGKVEVDDFRKIFRDQIALL